MWTYTANAKHVHVRTHLLKFVQLDQLKQAIIKTEVWQQNVAKPIDDVRSGLEAIRVTGSQTVEDENQKLRDDAGKSHVISV